MRRITVSFYFGNPPESECLLKKKGVTQEAEMTRFVSCEAGSAGCRKKMTESKKGIRYRQGGIYGSDNESWRWTGSL